MKEKWPEGEELAKVAARFWAKVERGNADECWIWKGTKNKFGRGLIHVQGRLRPAPRISYLLHKGNDDPLRVGTHVCHSCDKPSCVNPAHLWQGTPGENTADALRKNRVKSKLMPSDVRAIRKLARTAAEQRKCAEMFGITAGHAYAIYRRIYWPDLPD
jgi:hypothetical protein